MANARSSGPAAGLPVDEWYGYAVVCCALALALHSMFAFAMYEGAAGGHDFRRTFRMFVFIYGPASTILGAAGVHYALRGALGRSSLLGWGGAVAHLWPAFALLYLLLALVTQVSLALGGLIGEPDVDGFDPRMLFSWWLFQLCVCALALMLAMLSHRLALSHEGGAAPVMDDGRGMWVAGQSSPQSTRSSGPEEPDRPHGTAPGSRPRMLLGWYGSAPPPDADLPGPLAPGLALATYRPWVLAKSFAYLECIVSLPVIMIMGLVALQEDTAALYCFGAVGLFALPLTFVFVAGLCAYYVTESAHFLGGGRPERGALRASWPLALTLAMVLMACTPIYALDPLVGHLYLFVGGAAAVTGVAVNLLGHLWSDNLNKRVDGRADPDPALALVARRSLDICVYLALMSVTVLLPVLVSLHVHRLEGDVEQIAILQATLVLILTPMAGIYHAVLGVRTMRTAGMGAGALWPALMYLVIHGCFLGLMWMLTMPGYPLVMAVFLLLQLLPVVVSGFTGAVRDVRGRRCVDV